MAVTVYSTPTCPYCNMAKEYFAENDVAFEDVDVSNDQEKAKEMVKKSGQMGVPVILIPQEESKTGKEEVIVGFDRGRIAEALGTPAE